MKKTGLSDYSKRFSTNIFDVDLSLAIDIDRPQESPIYQCTLIEAYPTTMNAIQLNNEANGLVELNVQLSYDRWISK